MIRILKLLQGIRIAAIMGDKTPCTAKDIPIILYKTDITKAAITTFLLALHNLMRCTSCGSWAAERMASLAGVKLLLFSETAIPISA